jgi:hypothetical protein
MTVVVGPALCPTAADFWRQILNKKFHKVSSDKGIFLFLTLKFLKLFQVNNLKKGGVK